ncbi:MAG TPA: M3 family metallopeptidase [Casimicrobiaceae bacterium]|nr:M3 family metallopeptidase [Casimicrobiaceae bacterium]
MPISAANPLLEFPGLPRFDAVTPADVAPAIEALLDGARATIAAIERDEALPTWETVVAPLMDRLDRLHRAWNAVRILNAVVNTPALREAYHDTLPKITAFYTDLGQNDALYRKFLALQAAPQFAALAPAARRLIDNEVRDFRLGGAELDHAKRARFKEVKEALAEAGALFDEHVLDTENAWAHYVDDTALLAGIPAEVVAQARAAAEAEGRTGYKLTLRMPCYLPVMQYAENRVLRETMHRGVATIASELAANPAWNNGPLIDRIVALRREVATLLGYRNFAEVSLVPKMAETPAEVLAFLRDLGRRARPFAERDYAELVIFARDELDLAELAAWDLSYASEKLKARRYAYSEQELKRYLPEDKVIAGLFRLVETIYGVTIFEASASVWHPSVRFFQVRDGAGALVGEFYFDLYAREGKQGGAWMDDAINRRLIDGEIQHPVAYMICNLSPPTEGGPATFTHDEVITLFHEFGHGLHQLLTRVDVPGVSGIQGVEWDAVELPSQFMENYCWEWDVLKDMTAYVGDGPQRGTPLPRALFDKMRAAKNFQSGMALLRQIELALFDMLLYADYNPVAHTPWATPQALLDAVRKEVAVVPRPAYDRFMHSFSHIFDGGYAAGYYSYKWAEVLSADAYSLFEEAGVLSPAVGARFRDEILASGGSRSAMESFVAFRGRPPRLDALLRHNGMTLAS